MTVKVFLPDATCFPYRTLPILPCSFYILSVRPCNGVDEITQIRLSIKFLRKTRILLLMYHHQMTVSSLRQRVLVVTVARKVKWFGNIQTCFCFLKTKISCENLMFVEYSMSIQ